MNINVKVDTVKVRVYDQKKLDENEHIETVTLKMHYGGHNVLNPQAIEALKEGRCNILGVDIIYTDFRNKEVQELLNKKRIAELYFLYPDLFHQKLVNWRYVEQLGYATEAGAKNLFHGVALGKNSVNF